MVPVMMPFAWGSSWDGSFAEILAAGLIGTTFFLGQLFTFLAITRGDVSIATPVMGTKIVLVAILGMVFFGAEVSRSLWIAAGLATLGVVLLQYAPSKAGRQRLLFTLGAAGLSALFFAVTDVMVQRFGALYGVGILLPLGFLVTALLSFTLIPFFRSPLKRISRIGWLWLLPGAFLLALQAAGMAAALGLFGHATEVNVVYSLRGFWSVLLVWFLGASFGNDERKAGGLAFVFRTAGAILTIAAVGLLFSEA